MKPLKWLETATSFCCKNKIFCSNVLTLIRYDDIMKLDQERGRGKEPHRIENRIAGGGSTKSRGLKDLIGNTRQDLPTGLAGMRGTGDRKGTKNLKKAGSQSSERGGNETPKKNTYNLFLPWVWG